MQQISKHRILPGFNNREPIATSWVCEHYQTPVYVIVKKMTRNSPETPDLVSKTFLALLEHERPFESLRKLREFLYTAAKNISISYFRHLKTIRNSSDKVADFYLSNEEHGVEAAKQAATFHHLIHLGIEILPTRCKEVFLLCYIEQMKNAAIAHKLSISEKTVANLKLKAYDKLRKEIIATKHLWLIDLLGILLL
jgi:RNA polymerase sigma factor (sigma-70 family)